MTTPTSEVRVIKPLSGPYRLERTRHLDSGFAVCTWCGKPALVGTLLTRTRWHRGTPESHAAFLCDPCLLDINAADTEYIDTFITDPAGAK